MRLLIAIAACATSACIVSDPAIGDPHLEGVCIYGVEWPFEGSANHTARSSLGLAAIDLDRDLDLPGIDRITFASALVIAGSGVDHLGFADQLRAELVPATGPAVTLAQTAVPSAAASVNLDGNPDLNLADYVSDDPDVAIEVTGDVPGASWSAIIDLCFDAQ